MSSTIPTDIAILTCPVLLGHLINWALFGVLSVQVYIFYLAFPKDKYTIKALVYIVYTVEVVQTALATREAFRFLGTGWGNPAVLETVGWLGIIIPIIGSIVTWMSQTFYAWRIWVLRRSLWIPVPVALLSLVQLASGITSGIHIQLIGVQSQVEAHTFQTTALRLASALLCDLTIAGSMLEFLYRSRNGMRTTSNIISRLIRVIVETGLILLLVAVIDLTFFLAYPQNNYFYAPSMSLSKLYSNTMLVMLNVRVVIVGGRSRGVHADVEMSDATVSMPISPAVFAKGAGRKSTFDSIEVNHTAPAVH